MNKSLLFIFIALYQLSFAQTTHIIENPKVERNVELLSIVYRLAGVKAYNATYFKKYTDKIETHFEPYKNHEVVKFAGELRKKSGISYEAVMNMAIILDSRLNPRLDFSVYVPEKWNKDDAEKFVSLLKKFYKDAHCKEFFRENKELFREVSDRFRTINYTLDINWFPTFFGKNTDDDFSLIVSPGNGNNNYNASYTLPNGKKKIFIILGIWNTDESGMPVYDKGIYLPIVVHEFCHSFVNPLLVKYDTSFKESGQKIYKIVEYEMSHNQAYNDWHIMFNEALVRASVIKYFIDHGVNESEIQLKVKNELNLGFLWMNSLVAELKKYDRQRDRFPNLEYFFPNLSIAYKTFFAKLSEFDAQRPKVKSITEFANNDTTVNPQIKTITINFDRPLSGKGHSIYFGNKGKSAFPKLNSFTFSENKKSIILEVQLFPDKEYQLVLTGENYRTDQGIGLKTYEVNFKTTK